MKVSADCEGDARESKQSFMARHKQTNELPAQDLCFRFNAQASYNQGSVKGEQEGFLKQMYSRPPPGGQDDL